LLAHAGEVAPATGATTLVELGSGTSEKTQILLKAFLVAGRLERFVPVDLSEETLRAAVSELQQLFPTIAVEGLVGDFTAHLNAFPTGHPRLLIFLGGTIGKLESD
jgi:L-histidine Nalpha-methyltransferase